MLSHWHPMTQPCVPKECEGAIFSDALDMHVTIMGEHHGTWLCESCPDQHVPCMHAKTMCKDMTECTTLSRDMATCVR